MVPVPDPHQSVREIERSIGFTLAGTNLIAHKPLHAGNITDQIGKRNAALSDELIAEDDAVVAELEFEEEAIHHGRASFGEKPQIETRFVVPFRVASVVAVPVCRGSLRLRFFVGEFRGGVVGGDGDEGVEGEFLEEVEGLEIFAGNEFQLYGTGFHFGGKLKSKSKSLVFVKLNLGQMLTLER